MERLKAITSKLRRCSGKTRRRLRNSKAHRYYVLVDIRIDPIERFSSTWSRSTGKFQLLEMFDAESFSIKRYTMLTNMLCLFYKALWMACLPIK